MCPKRHARILRAGRSALLVGAASLSRSSRQDISIHSPMREVVGVIPPQDIGLAVAFEVRCRRDEWHGRADCSVCKTRYLIHTRKRVDAIGLETLRLSSSCRCRSWTAYALVMILLPGHWTWMRRTSCCRGFRWCPWRRSRRQRGCRFPGCHWSGARGSRPCRRH